MTIVDGVEFQENDSFDYEGESKPIKFVDSHEKKDNKNLDKNTIINHTTSLPKSRDESMMDWLVNKGIVKTHAMAKKILIVVIIVNIVITIIAFIS